jgi:hypothetical protein
LPEQRANGPRSSSLSLRELGCRAQFLDRQLDRLDELIVPLVTARAPGLLARYGVGPHTASMLLIAVGDHPERLQSEAGRHWMLLAGRSAAACRWRRLSVRTARPGDLAAVAGRSRPAPDAGFAV